jgi:hypothetical protein
MTFSPTALESGMQCYKLCPWWFIGWLTKFTTVTVHLYQHLFLAQQGHDLQLLITSLTEVHTLLGKLK